MRSKPHVATSFGTPYWFALLTIISLQSSLVLSQSTVHISNQKIYVNGQEFYVKGMVYQPTPLGIKDMDSQGYGGGGFCSAKLTPFNEWKSACFDYDFFDGAPSTPDRDPPGPSKWFSAIWGRDLPILKELGVNTIRIYSANPITQKAVKGLAASKWNGVSQPYGKSHVEFMDACLNFGIRVLFPLTQDVASFASDSTDILEQKFENLINEVGNHPALLGFVVGSDWGLESASQKSIVDKLNNMIKFSKDYMRKQYGKFVPITHCVSNLPGAAPFFGQNLNIDFLCANAGWNGPSGLKTFLGDQTANTSWISVAKNRGWPILVGEAGQVYNESESDPTWFNRLWKQTLDLDTLGVVGSVYFEYSDQVLATETWRRNLGVVSPSMAVDGLMDSTQENIFWPDNISKKQDLFDAVKSGKVDGDTVNYNIDVFRYMGRQPTKHQASPSQFGAVSGSVSIFPATFILILSILTFLLYI